ncbi:O-antigen ligase family protein [Halobacillus amylolyticus]|uniref:O-antigen ligase family protein n=1 Tax=Halobacillus amylolyticus TaxID=2932259 RepID=A0ABY4HD25_9BACI|nr:O-antigen ligase family protein [Halobacillus amylolyticus]UOR11315.1 O-antigen ligase family protein [Halobacillus amylolyticus]
MGTFGMVIKFDKNSFFKVIVIYYWLLILLIDYGATSNRSSTQYFLIMLPIIFYILINMNVIVRKRVTLEVFSLLMFLFFAISFSIVKFDINPIFGLLIWVLPIIIVLNNKVYLSIKLVNTLFILTIVAGVFAYHIGVNVYGYIPGQSTTNLTQGLWWRISMFPYSTPPLSAVFALIVLILNFFYNNSFKWKVFFVILSSYFLVLSGSRTALIVTALILMTLFISKIFNSKMTFLKKALSVSPILMFLTLFIFPEFLLILDFNNPFFNSLIFRSTDSSQSLNEILKTMNRQTIWEDYFHIYIDSPIIGGSSEEIKEVGHSETMLFRYLALYGLSIIFLLSFLYLVIANSLMKKNYLRYAIGIILFVYLLVYSSYFQTYNFIFLLLLGLLNFNNSKTSVK